MKCLKNSVKSIVIAGLFCSTPLLTYADSCSHHDRDRCHHHRHKCKKKCPHECKGKKGDRGPRGCRGRPGANATFVSAYGEWFVPPITETEFVPIGSAVPYDCTTAVVEPLDVKCKSDGIFKFLVSGVYEITYAAIGNNNFTNRYQLFRRNGSSGSFTPVPHSTTNNVYTPLTIILSVSKGDQVQLRCANPVQLGNCSLMSNAPDVDTAFIQFVRIPD